MGFNFGAFIGGLSQQIVSDVEREEERVAEIEKIAQTEAMRERAAAAASRRAKQETTDTLMGALSMFYSPEAAAQIASRGEMAAEFALDAAQKAAAKGIDPNTLYNFPTVGEDLSDTATQEKVSGIISAAPPKISETVTTMGDGTSGPTIRAFGMNPETYSQIYGEPTEIANSYGAAIAQISQRIVREKDPTKRAALETERDALIADYGKMEAAGRAPTEEDGGAVFNYGTLSASVNEALRTARTRYGFDTDIEGNILNMTEGNEHKSYISELAAAETLNATYGPLNDRAMNDRIGIIREQANRDLIDYGRRTMADGSSQRLKMEPTAVAFANNLVGGQYRIGDVITYTENGVTKYYIYTGVPNKDGLPIVVGE
jgi:hypothetical protein